MTCGQSASGNCSHGSTRRHPGRRARQVFSGRIAVSAHGPELLGQTSCHRRTGRAHLDGLEGRAALTASSEREGERDCEQSQKILHRGLPRLLGCGGVPVVRIPSDTTASRKLTGLRLNDQVINPQIVLSCAVPHFFGGSNPSVAFVVAKWRAVPLMRFFCA